MVTLAVIPVPVQAIYNKTLLEAAQPALLYQRFAVKPQMPKHAGEKMIWRRYENIETTETPLTEGITPHSVQPTHTEVEANPKQYGTYMKLTDKVSIVNADPIIQVMTKKLGTQQMGVTLDNLSRDRFVAVANVMYARSAGTTGRTDVDEKLQKEHLAKAIRTLHRTNTQYKTSILTGSTKVGTTPIRGGYCSIIHCDTYQDLENITGFKPAAEYPGKDALPDEVGSWREIRFFMTTQAKVYRAGGDDVAQNTALISDGGVKIDVYATMVFGEEYFGIVPVSGENARVYVKPIGSSGSEDPLDQRGTIGWKAFLDPGVILNDDFAVRIEHGCSKDPGA